MPQDPNQEQSGAGTETPETPQGATDNSLNTPGKEQTLDERLSGATSPAELARLMADLESGAVKPAVEKSTTPDEPSPGEGGEETPATPKGNADEPADNRQEPADSPADETPPETPSDGENTLPDEDEPKEPKGSEEQLPERIRLSNFNKVEKLALVLKKENPKLTLAEAEAKAREALGVQDESTTKEGSAEKADDGLPKTMAEIDVKVAELEAAADKAADDLDIKESRRLEKEIRRLERHRLVVRDREEAQAREQAAVYHEAFDASAKKAAGLYDFASQRDSAGWKRMEEIDRTLKETNDPLWAKPDKPLIIAQMVATELRIPPRSATALKAPARTPAQVKRTVPPVASGASRTNSNNTQEAALQAKIDALRTPEDIEKFLAMHGG